MSCIHYEQAFESLEIAVTLETNERGIEKDNCNILEDTFEGGTKTVTLNGESNKKK